MDKKKLNSIVNEMMKYNPEFSCWIGCSGWSFNRYEIWGRSINYSKKFGFTEEEIVIEKHWYGDKEILNIKELLTQEEKDYIYFTLLKKIKKKHDSIINKENIILSKLGLNRDEFLIIINMINNTIS